MTPLNYYDIIYYKVEKGVISMEKALVSKTYQSLEQVSEVFIENGKTYVKVKEICDRCGGRGSSNNYAWAVNGGICFKCHGVGHFFKDVRAYTQKEFDSKEKAAQRQNELNKQRKDEANIEKNINFLLNHNFINENTWAIIGNSYSIRMELKDIGGIFVKGLGWLFKEEINLDAFELGLKMIQLNKDQVTYLSSGVLKFKEVEELESLINSFKEPNPSTFQGSPGARIERMVTIIKKSPFSSQYGESNAISMIDKNGNVYTWFTATDVISEGNEYKISGTVKEHTEYKNVKQTVLTRCKVI